MVFYTSLTPSPSSSETISHDFRCSNSKELFFLLGMGDSSPAHNFTSFPASHPSTTLLACACIYPSENPTNPQISSSMNKICTI